MKDLTKLTFGGWTVDSYAGKRGKVPYWNCVCVCGHKQEVCGWNLTSGKTTSCGCLRSQAMFDDLTGRQFGRLEVLRYDGKHVNGTHSVYLCLCECGNEKLIMAQSLKNGLTLSCGCLHLERVSAALVGRRFGKLVVLSRTGKRKGNGSYHWRCRCDCGQEKAVAGSVLVRGDTRSCGCLLRTRGGRSGTKAFRAFYSRQRRDRERLYDIVWTAEMEEALIEFFPACVLCRSTERLTVDHVQPLSLGFGLEPGNAVRLCGNCNSKKIDKPLTALPPTTAKILRKSAAAYLKFWNQKALLKTV